MISLFKQLIFRELFSLRMCGTMLWDKGCDAIKIIPVNNRATLSYISSNFLFYNRPETLGNISTTVSIISTDIREFNKIWIMVMGSQYVCNSLLN